jgi:hypothetical protein
MNVARGSIALLSAALLVAWAAALSQSGAATAQGVSTTGAQRSHSHCWG